MTIGAGGTGTEVVVVQKLLVDAEFDVEYEANHKYLRKSESSGFIY
jgi:hypothetical protein